MVNSKQVLATAVVTGAGLAAALPSQQKDKAVSDISAKSADSVRVEVNTKDAKPVQELVDEAFAQSKVEQPKEFAEIEEVERAGFGDSAGTKLTWKWCPTI